MKLKNWGAAHAPSSSAWANSIMSPGRISGTPPTRVETTNSPVEAASMMLIPNASVSEVFRYIWPRVSTCGRESVGGSWREGGLSAHRGRRRDGWIRAVRSDLGVGISPSSVRARPSWARLRLQPCGYQYWSAGVLVQAGNDFMDVPTTKRTSGKRSQICGAEATRRSMPFR